MTRGWGPGADNLKSVAISGELLHGKKTANEPSRNIPLSTSRTGEDEKSFLLPQVEKGPA